MGKKNKHGILLGEQDICRRLREQGICCNCDIFSHVM